MRALHPIDDLMEFRDTDLALSPDVRAILCEALSHEPRVS